MGESAEILAEVLEFEKDLSLQIERLGHYASLATSGDSSNAENLSRESIFENLLTLIGEATAFIAPEIQALDDDAFESYLADPALADGVISLRKLRRFKPHTLTANEERLLALGQSALRGHGETFSQLTNVDMKFGVVADEKGVERELTQSSFSSFLVKRDPEVRRNAPSTSFTRNLTLISLRWRPPSRIRLRRMCSMPGRGITRARGRRRYFHDDMPVSVYDNLI